MPPDRQCFFAPAFELPESVFHDLDQRIPLRGSFPEQVGLADRHVEFAAANPDPVLAAVVLFLHEEIETLKSPQAGLVFVVVISEVVLEPDKGQTALMFYGITHSVCNFDEHISGARHFSQNSCTGMKRRSLIPVFGGDDRDPSPTHVEGVDRFGIFDVLQDLGNGSEFPSWNLEIRSFSGKEAFQVSGRPPPVM